MGPWVGYKLVSKLRIKSFSLSTMSICLGMIRSIRSTLSNRPCRRVSVGLDMLFLRACHLAPALEIEERSGSPLSPKTSSKLKGGRDDLLRGLLRGTKRTRALPACGSAWKNP